MLTWKWISAAGVELFVSGGRHLEDVPLDAGVVLLQVDPQLHVVRLGRLVDMPQVNLRSVGVGQIVNV